MNFSFETLNEREKRMVIAGAVIAVIVLIVAVIMPLDRSVARAHERVERKQTDLAWMKSVAPQLANADPSTTAPATQDSLLVVVDRAAREAGLDKALTSSEPSGAGGLRVRLDKAPFDTLIGWLGRLADRHGIRVESANIDSATEPGLVNAALVLHVG
jgi:type II secretory pathway component PulM